MNHKLIYLIIACAFFNSCKKDIDIDIEEGENNILVVEGYITTEANTHVVKLSKSTNYYFSDGTVPLSGASVNIKDNISTFTLTESPDNPGEYLTDSIFAAKEFRYYCPKLK